MTQDCKFRFSVLLHFKNHEIPLDQIQKGMTFKVNLYIKNIGLTDLPNNVFLTQQNKENSSISFENQVINEGNPIEKGTLIKQPVIIKVTKDITKPETVNLIAGLFHQNYGSIGQQENMPICIIDPENEELEKLKFQRPQMNKYESHEVKEEPKRIDERGNTNPYQIKYKISNIRKPFN